MESPSTPPCVVDTLRRRGSSSQARRTGRSSKRESQRWASSQARRTESSREVDVGTSSPSDGCRYRERLTIARRELNAPFSIGLAKSPSSRCSSRAVSTDSSGSSTNQRLQVPQTPWLDVGRRYCWPGERLDRVDVDGRYLHECEARCRPLRPKPRNLVPCSRGQRRWTTSKLLDTIKEA